MTVLVVVLVAWVAWARLGLDPLVVAGAALAAGAAWSAFAAVFWPFVSCPAPFCDKGKVRRPGKRGAWRKCTWCKGAGARVRLFRRFYDEVRPTKHRRR